MVQRGWWVAVTAGTAYVPANLVPPRGPWASKEEADAALARWAERVGCRAGDIRARTSLHVVGPFRTRRDARDADISDYPEAIRASWKKA